MADSVILEPEKQITNDAGGGPSDGSLLNDDTRKALETAFQNKSTQVVKSEPAQATTAKADADAKVAADKAAALAVKTKADTDAKAADDAKKATYPRSAIQWEEWKKNERERMEKEFNDKFKASTVDTKALEDIRKERDDYVARLRAVAIERDPAFEREFVQASDAVVQMIKSNVGIAKADEASKILGMQPSQARDDAIDKFMEGLPAYKQTQFGYALAEMDKLRHVKASKIAEAQANWTKLQAESQSKQESERRDMQQVFERTIAEWSDKEKGLPILQKRDNDPDWNTKVDESTRLARDIFGGELELDELARASIWAATAPLLLEDNAALLKKISGLEAQIKELSALSPGADGGAETTVGKTGEEVPENLNYGAAMAAAIRKAGIPMP